ncbi:MAG: hypothetical protein IKH92_06295 [Clostridiales bacterium]|nr:hypothetical protein [Clostridiales bacterium]
MRHGLFDNIFDRMVHANDDGDTRLKRFLIELGIGLVIALLVIFLP